MYKHEKRKHQYPPNVSDSMTNKSTDKDMELYVNVRIPRGRSELLDISKYRKGGINGHRAYCLLVPVFLSKEESYICCDNSYDWILLVYQELERLKQQKAARGGRLDDLKECDFMKKYDTRFLITSESGVTTRGKVVMTRGIAHCIETVEGVHDEIMHCFLRYSVGNWGDLCDEDKQMNEDAIKTGEDRIFAAYNTTQGKIYIITEWDRSYTTILFADEY